MGPEPPDENLRVAGLVGMLSGDRELLEQLLSGANAAEGTLDVLARPEAREGPRAPMLPA